MFYLFSDKSNSSEFLYQVILGFGIPNTSHGKFKDDEYSPKVSGLAELKNPGFSKTLTWAEDTAVEKPPDLRFTCN